MEWNNYLLVGKVGGWVVKYDLRYIYICIFRRSCRIQTSRKIICLAISRFVQTVCLLFLCRHFDLMALCNKNQWHTTMHHRLRNGQTCLSCDKLTNVKYNHYRIVLYYMQGLESLFKKQMHSHWEKIVFSRN